jgi:hypothetical protein
VPTDFLSVLDGKGRSIPAPCELVVRREGFAARFGGLQYDVRRSVRLGDERVVSVRTWQFDLLPMMRAERAGWSFAWYGEHVATPVWYVGHTDGRCGVSAGGPFLEVWPSFHHLIESHALTDELADWEPMASSSLEAWAPYAITDEEYLNELVAGLPFVPEASGPCSRWWRSEHMAVHLFDAWTATIPRSTGVMIWSRTGRL